MRRIKMAPLSYVGATAPYSGCVKLSGLGGQDFEELFEVAALGVVGVVLEVVVEPLGGGLGHADSREDQGEVALEAELVGPEEDLHLQHGGDVGVGAGGAEDVEEVLEHAGEPVPVAGGLEEIFGPLGLFAEDLAHAFAGLVRSEDASG